jgi:hypothetical protein
MAFAPVFMRYSVHGGGRRYRVFNMKRLTIAVVFVMGFAD